MRVLFVVILGFYSALSNAELVYSGKIAQIHTGPQYQGRVFVETEDLPVGDVACSTNGSFSYVFDGTTEEGSLYLSILLSALAAGRDVIIKSSDDCTLYTNVADLRNLSIK
ncbi:hypothetical protein ACJJIW_19035 [Microbulbifer sp. JMSA004]|uniref:hypothetical protein n=1 Tax=unclassified Microbulbifer TaxID=2619833 RepID=UPI0024AE230F|nr:hypothetical protein [Microbulbifer sp. VAAF005]WHI46878.1 hypothetical protein P0078_00465 [Microbulbifer sp. VAAF005]